MSAGSKQMPKLVTFDCAQTIVHVNWSVGGFARDCMAHLGVEVSPFDASRFEAMYHERLLEYVRINMTRDADACDRFWARLADDWLHERGLGTVPVEHFMQTMGELAYGPGSEIFQAYPDVVPCFERLRNAGIKLAVISNWDYSLHRVLAMFGLQSYLDVALASLEEGVEKPDPRLFRIALERLGTEPSDTVHVGDHPVDDVAGAESAGIRPILLDRSGTLPGSIDTLDRLEEAIGWTA